MSFYQAFNIRRSYLSVGGVIASLSLALLLNSAQAAQVQVLQNSKPQRILFVGNSYFYYNDSLHNHVRRIVD